MDQERDENDRNRTKNEIPCGVQYYRWKMLLISFFAAVFEMTLKIAGKKAKLYNINCSTRDETFVFNENQYV